MFHISRGVVIVFTNNVIIWGGVGIEFIGLRLAERPVLSILDWYVVVVPNTE